MPVRGEILADAVAALRGGDTARALALADGLLARDGSDPDALTVRGMALQARGAVQDAIAAMRAAHAADPANPARAVNLGLALKAGGLHDEAVVMLQQAVAARPQHAPGLANLGSCLIAAGGTFPSNESAPSGWMIDLLSGERVQTTRTQRGDFEPRQPSGLCLWVPDG